MRERNYWIDAEHFPVVKLRVLYDLVYNDQIFLSDMIGVSHSILLILPLGRQITFAQALLSFPRLHKAKSAF